MSIPETVKIQVENGIQVEAEREGSGNMDVEAYCKVTHLGHCCGTQNLNTQNRYHSFAPQRVGGNVKWYVDSCRYFWALSLALENAQCEIWIMGWWLSPQLYLRRPPLKNLRYRLDRMLQAAAFRGVKVNIIINNDPGEENTSKDTQVALESLHESIEVFRHSYHRSVGNNIESGSTAKFHALSSLSRVTKEAVNNSTDIPSLDWCNHEKLCIVDRRMAFMGGLDMCFGRWDTNAYPIADAHPNSVLDTLFPGQDFNNSRAFNFTRPDHPKQSRLNRTTDCRMGWTDPAICLEGSVVQDLVAHFAQRWSFEYALKYGSVPHHRYHELSLERMTDACHSYVSNTPETTELKNSEISAQSYDQSRHMDCTSKGQKPLKLDDGDVEVRMQIVRSVSEWCHGTPTEHSIANAYIEIIDKSQHFLYFEHQYFITATTDKQRPVLNKIGRKIVDRIIGAAKQEQKFKVIVVMPAMPAFAGDVQYDSSPGTLAIMDFQYRSISRGGSSIMEKIREAGFDPTNYISFYNLRSYDRINTNASMANAESKSGVSYESARKAHDDEVGARFYGHRNGAAATMEDSDSPYTRYQRATDAVESPYDSVSSAYMHNGPTLTHIPWEKGNVNEIDAFVSEEVYVHSKLLIADDRVVIIGSANLGDRSLLGNRDSEIDIIIEDNPAVDSHMNGEPFKVASFAASLRRNIFRKHLGLLVAQDPTRPDDSYLPVNMSGNRYDWSSSTDRLVEDPLSVAFEELWTNTARTNTDIFDRVFRLVPNNAVRNLRQYHEHYGMYFDQNEENKQQSKYRYGHVFKENFPGGVQEVKHHLERVSGTLVEMPLKFLVDVSDLAGEGFNYEPFQAEVYT